MLFATALLCVGATGCGDTGKDASASATPQPTSNAAIAHQTTHTARAAPSPDWRKADSDDDNDFGALDDSRDNNSVLHFGKEANASDTQAIKALIKRYYTAALQEDGAGACTMLYSVFAEGVPEDYGTSPPGPSYMKGKTCPSAMTKLFKHMHAQLRVELPKLAVSHVRLEEHHGLAVLSFGRLPERDIFVTREGHTWKVAGVLDGELS
ncbi:MAG: hypothetical protein WA484_13300 [Solirubrobacteraceae bacterium]